MNQSIYRCDVYEKYHIPGLCAKQAKHEKQFFNFGKLEEKKRHIQTESHNDVILDTGIYSGQPLQLTCFQGFQMGTTGKIYDMSNTLCKFCWYFLTLLSLVFWFSFFIDPSPQTLA